MVNCPICRAEACEAIIDLCLCLDCNHLFKPQPVKSPQYMNSNEWKLHLIDNPVVLCQGLYDMMEKDQVATFIFPSMNFYAAEINPALFYRHEYNHYFNQLSLMILLERAGLIPIEQTNVWSGAVCETTIKVRKKTEGEW